jgi:hypothetical protein
MDALKTLVAAGCGTDGVISAQNPLMTAVDSGLQQLLWASSGAPTSTTSDGALRPGMTFNMRSPVHGAPASVPVDNTAQLQLERAWAASATPYAQVAHSNPSMPQYTQHPGWSEIPAPYAFAQPYNHQQHMWVGSSPPTHTLSVMSRLQDSAQVHLAAPQQHCDALEADYEGAMSVMAGQESNTHARTVVAALERAAETNANIRNSQFLGFMREFQDGARGNSWQPPCRPQRC